MNALRTRSPRRRLTAAIAGMLMVVAACGGALALDARRRRRRRAPSATPAPRRGAEPAPTAAAGAAVSDREPNCQTMTTDPVTLDLLGRRDREPLRRRRRDPRRGVQGEISERHPEADREDVQRHPHDREAAGLRAEPAGHPDLERWLRAARATRRGRAHEAPRRVRLRLRLARPVPGGDPDPAAVLR